MLVAALSLLLDGCAMAPSRHERPPVNIVNLRCDAGLLPGQSCHISVHIFNRSHREDLEISRLQGTVYINDFVLGEITGDGPAVASPTKWTAVDAMLALKPGFAIEQLRALDTLREGRLHARFEGLIYTAPGVEPIRVEWHEVLEPTPGRAGRFR